MLPKSRRRLFKVAKPTYCFIGKHVASESASDFSPANLKRFIFYLLCSVFGRLVEQVDGAEPRLIKSTVIKPSATA